VLNLSKNAITTVGVRKIINPYRMFKRGPTKLLMVNISGMKHRKSLLSILHPI